MDYNQYQPMVTSDLSKFGYRELKIAAKLIRAYLRTNTDYLGDGLSMNFNKESGYVFLSDEDFGVAMLDSNGKLLQWFSCPNCGNEGFDKTQSEDGEFKFIKHKGCCSKKCEDELDPYSLY